MGSDSKSPRPAGTSDDGDQTATAADETGPNRQSRSDDTLAKLHEATIDLIVELGWDRASSRKVAERAGVSLGVVHYHADSIAELRRTAALGVIEQFFSTIAVAVLDLEDPTEAVRVTFEMLASGDPRRRELSVLYQALVAAAYDEELAKTAATMIGIYRQLVEEFLAQRGVRSARSVAVTVLAATDGYLLQRALDPELRSEPIVDGLTQLIRASMG